VREWVCDRADTECPLWRETGANSLDNLSSGWHDAECCESSTVDDGLTIYEHLVLAKSAVNHVDIGPQVTSQLRCHTGGVQTRQSVRAISNDNPSHFEFLVYFTTERGVRLTDRA
jgi:hypothetical protein